MKTYRFEWISGIVMVLALLLFCRWQQPSQALNAMEVDAYITRLEATLPWPEADKRAMLTHTRAWALADDGRPVHMLNLMRYFDTLAPLPQLKGFTGSPREANTLYEDLALPLLLKRGGYPMFAGAPGGATLQGSTNLVGFDAAVDRWSRVLVVRYPSRRAFMELLCDPAYANIVSYKAAALTLVLAPLQSEMVLPDMRWVAAVGLLLVWLAMGWGRAIVKARRGGLTGNAR